MKTYARIESGRVVEIIEPMVYEIDAPGDQPDFKSGEEVPIERRFTPEIVATLVDVGDLSSVGIGDAYANGIFTPCVSPAPTAAQLLTQAQAAQIAKVSASCQATILAGFTSSALGATRNYPSQDTDQRNLLSAVSASVGAATGWATPIWCAVGDVWSFESHSAAQVQQVNGDWLAARVVAQKKYADLVAQINAAATVAAVEAIDW